VKVARSANALDPSIRTLLVEIREPNADNALLPGMYTHVELTDVRADPPLLVSSDAMIVRADGAQIAMVGPDGTVHLQKSRSAVITATGWKCSKGLREGDTIISGRGDTAREGVKVDAISATAMGK
jgi:hypothetical protein